jgi:hypothetical protein
MLATITFGKGLTRVLPDSRQITADCHLLSANSGAGEACGAATTRGYRRM